MFSLAVAQIRYSAICLHAAASSFDRIYLLKVNNENFRRTGEIRSEITVKTPEQLY